VVAEEQPGRCSEGTRSTRNAGIWWSLRAHNASIQLQESRKWMGHKGRAGPGPWTIQTGSKGSLGLPH